MVQPGVMMELRPQHENGVDWITGYASDTMLPSTKFAKWFGNSIYYKVAMVFVAIMIVVLGTQALGSLHPVVWTLFNLPTLFMLYIEMSTRMNRTLVLRVMQHFEFWYLLMWVICYYTSALLRGFYTNQEWDTTLSVYFTSIQLFIIFGWVLFLDSTVHRRAQSVKRLWLCLLFCYIIFRTFEIRWEDPNAYSFCWVICTDTNLMESSARVNLGIFIAKYLVIAFRYPNQFLILRGASIVKMPDDPNGIALEEINNKS